MMLFIQAVTKKKCSFRHGDFDTLDSPSSRIVVGRVVEGGTGSFDVLQPLTTVA